MGEEYEILFEAIREQFIPLFVYTIVQYELHNQAWCKISSYCCCDEFSDSNCTHYQLYSSWLTRVRVLGFVSQKLKIKLKFDFHGILPWKSIRKSIFSLCETGPRSGLTAHCMNMHLLCIFCANHTGFIIAKLYMYAHLKKI